MSRMPNICPGCGSKRTESLQRRIDGEDFDCPVCDENFRIETSDPEAVRRRFKNAVNTVSRAISSDRPL